MVVYRFERNGVGPFVGRTRINAFRICKNKFAKTKTNHIRNQYGINKRQHGIAHMDRTYIFGCPSKEALRAYFSFNFKYLFAEGYRIKAYEVPDNEIVDMGIEVAFPVKYHKFKSQKKLREAVSNLHG